MAKRPELDQYGVEARSVLRSGVTGDIIFMQQLLLLVLSGLRQNKKQSPSFLGGGVSCF